MNPTQNPKHKEHLKSSSKNLSLHKKVRNHNNIVPYFNIKVNPRQDKATNTIVTSTY
jgi:hypothetical protein